MKIKLDKVKIYIDETILIVIFLSIVCIKIRKYFENFFVCYLFIIFHELSHMLIASIFGIKTTKISFCISGLNIKLSELREKEIKWLVIFLAGPMANIILAIIFMNIPIVYNINLALVIINLVPIYPLDGYNIFEIILNMMNVKRIKKIQKIIENTFIILLAILGLYQVIFLKNPSIILMVFYIIIQNLNTRKNYNSGLYQECYKNVTKN